LKIEVFHSGQLYGIREAVTAVSTGSVEMAGVLDLNFVPMDKNFMLGLMGYMWDGYAKQREFWTKNPVGRSRWDGIQKKLGINILCYDPVGPVCMFSTKKLTGTVEELKGRKIRYLTVSEKPGYAALGMSMVSVSTGEMFTALKQGMIDTLSTNPSAIKAYSWWDFAKFAALPYDSYADAFIVANAKWWNGLPEDIRKIILTQVAPKIGQEATDSIIQSSNDMLKEFTAEHGGTVVVRPPAELKKMIQIYKTQAWPQLGKEMDPNVYNAALEFTGNK
jgi:C4-dicarboxylate-binding protein DctP